MSEQTAVTKRAEMRPEVEARIAENKARNAVARAIRGTQWGKDLGPEGAYALAEYCRSNNLDPVRHVEVLGGRPYLTAEYYRERAAVLIRSGLVIPEPIDFINADDRLEKLAQAGDEWAKGELVRRMRERIRLNAPEQAKAIAVKRIRIARSGQVVEGANWCGGVRQRDPVGDAEPTKTAESRAERRAWRQLAEVVSEYAAAVRPAEESVETVSDAIVEEIKATDSQRPQLVSGATKGAVVPVVEYDHADMPTPDEAQRAARRALEQPDPYGLDEEQAA